MQPNDYVLADLRVDAYSGRTSPTSSMLSLGGSWAQLDLGYRDHWRSPLTGSSMIMSTQRYGGDSRTRDDGSVDSDDAAEEETPRKSPHGAEILVDAGGGASKTRVDLEPGLPITTTPWNASPHLGIGARREVTDSNDLATPAFSLYGGVGGQWRDIVPGYDLGVDFRHAQNVARDHVLATDVQGTRPDSFYKIASAILYVSRRF